MKKTLSIILSIVMLFSTIMSTNLSAFADDIEYDDILSVNNEWYESFLYDENTVDFYKVVLPSDGQLSIKLMQYMNWINFDLYDSDLSNHIDGKRISGGSASSPATNTFTYDLSKDTYYIKITKDGNFSGRYKICKTFSPFGNNETEPNDYETAMLLSDGKTITGAFTIQDYVDWYKLNIKSNIQITIKLMQYMNWINYDLYNRDLSNHIDGKRVSGGSVSSPVTNTFTYDLSKGTYYIKITKDNNFSGKYKLLWNLNISVSTPSNFKVTTRNTNSLKLSWSKVSGVSGYQLQRKSGSSYVNVTTTTATSATVSNLSTATNYSFRVRAYKTVDGKKYYGSWKTLTTPTRPGKVSIKSPSTNSSHKITAKWNTVTRANGYQIQYCSNSSCTNVVASKVVSGGSMTSCTGSYFTKGRTYYIRVRAYKSANGAKYYGSWSSVKSIRCK